MIKQPYIATAFNHTIFQMIILLSFHFRLILCRNSSAASLRGVARKTLRCAVLQSLLLASSTATFLKRSGQSFRLFAILRILTPNRPGEIFWLSALQVSFFGLSLRFGQN